MANMMRNEDDVENHLLDVFEKQQISSRSMSAMSVGSVERGFKSPPTSPFQPASRKSAIMLRRISKDSVNLKDSVKSFGSAGSKASYPEKSAINRPAAVPKFPTALRNSKFKDAVNLVKNDIHKAKQYGSVGPSAASNIRSQLLNGSIRPGTSQNMSFANLAAGVYRMQTDADHMFDRAERVAQLFEHKPSAIMEEDDYSDDEYEEEEENKQTEEEALLYKKHDEGDVETNSIHSTCLVAQIKKRRRKKRGCCYRCCRSMRNQYIAVKEVLNPWFIFVATCRFLFFKVLLIMVPCAALAYGLFYHLGDPQITFLPGTASISWWLIFFVRQMLTLQLAIIIEHIFCDIIALRSTLSVKLLGPLLTLALCNAEGWPFIVTCWGFIDVCILHGDQPFILNWLYFLNIDMLSGHDAGILNSPLYTRILLGVLFVGTATIIKRTYMALYFGKRMFLHFRNRTEKILTRMQIFSQLAHVADIAETERHLYDSNSLHFQDEELEDIQRNPYDGIEFMSIKSTKNSGASDPDDSVIKSASSLPAIKREDDEEDDEGYHSHKQIQFSEKTTVHEREFSPKDVKMEHWEEPMGAGTQIYDPVIQDILNFRKALGFMNSPYPFSDSFGSFDTREQFLQSATDLYKRLHKFRADDSSRHIPFEVLTVIAYDDDGNFDVEKEKTMSKMFKPCSKSDLVTYEDFLQACDTMYKKLRFFLAAVENASKIDTVLERTAKYFFFSFLAVVLMTILEFDPWSLLLSVSSLLVSFSFALGPSISTFVGGVLLIADRRPYDIGDRIVINSPTSDDAFQPGITWFVEDVNLSYTTLRFAATNEVATITNGSLAQLRIHNGNRDQNALVTVPLFFQVTTTHEEVMQFYHTVEAFINENDQAWKRIKFFRTESLNTALGYIEYRLRVEHVHSHQATPKIMIHKGELMRFCLHEMLKRDIHAITSHSPIDLYIEKGQGIQDLEPDLTVDGPKKKVSSLPKDAVFKQYH